MYNADYYTQCPRQRLRFDCSVCHLNWMICTGHLIALFYYLKSEYINYTYLEILVDTVKNQCYNWRDSILSLVVLNMFWWCQTFHRKQVTWWLTHKVEVGSWTACCVEGRSSGKVDYTHLCCFIFHGVHDEVPCVPHHSPAVWSTPCLSGLRTV